MNYREFGFLGIRFLLARTLTGCSSVFDDFSEEKTELKKLLIKFVKIVLKFILFISFSRLQILNT